jgi:hypothetical protein
MMTRTKNLLKINGAFIAIIIILSLAACAAPGDAAEPIAGQPVPTAEPSAAPAGAAEPTAVRPTPTAEPGATTDTAAELSPEALGEATYHGILEQPVDLTDGRFEGLPYVEGQTARPMVTLLPETVTYGDTDGDGQTDTVVLLVADTGGSGTFVYLAAVEIQDGRPVNVATTLLGDRVQVESLSIEDGQIAVTLLTHGPDDPQCCPSQEQTRVFRLTENQLVE